LLGDEGVAAGLGGRGTHPWRRPQHRVHRQPSRKDQQRKADRELISGMPSGPLHARGAASHGHHV